MKAPSPKGLPRIDVSTAELEALLEQGGHHSAKTAIKS